MFFCFAVFLSLLLDWIGWSSGSLLAQICIRSVRSFPSFTFKTNCALHHTIINSHRHPLEEMYNYVNTRIIPVRSTGIECSLIYIFQFQISQLLL